MRILIVEDSETDAIVLQHALEKKGHEVTIRYSAEEAVVEIRSCHYPVVICDWELPGQNGVELCRQIRERSASHYTYVIILTSRSEKKFVIEGLAAGADDYLTKPFEPQELFFRVRVAERLLSLQGRDVIIFSLAKLAESRDSDTGAHLERIREYCRLLTELLAATPRFQPILDADFVASIYLTSPLHDIGKVGIPDNILLKPGRLTEAEFEVMKQHALMGGQTLHAAVEKHPEHSYLKMARDIALTHHEKFNGTGYPYGLAGQEIPLCGRIVALADVYDALTSKRVYKNAFSHLKACNIIRCESGTHFDPEIARVFLKHHERFNEIRHAFVEHSEASENAEQLSVEEDSKPAEILKQIVLGSSNTQVSSSAASPANNT